MNKKWIIIIVCLIIAGAILLQEEETKVMDDSLRMVTVDQMTTGSISKVFKVNGIVKNEFEIYDASILQGKVSKVLVKKGDVVDVGTPLIQLDTTGDYDTVDFQIKQLSSSISELRLLVNQYEEQKIKQEKLLAVGASTREEILSIDNQLSQYRLQISKQLEQVEQLNKSKENASTKSVIKATSKGVVTELSIEAGGFVTGEDRLKIRKSNHQYVHMDVTEKYLKELHVGMAVSVEVDGEKIIGILDEVRESDDLFYPVKIKIDGDYKHGLTAEMTLPIYRNEKADLISDRAIIKYNGESFVYCVEDGYVVKKPVELGMSRDGKTEILSGLDKMDLVIVKGQFSVYESERVEVTRNE